MLSCPKTSGQRSRELSPTKPRLVVPHEFIREICSLYRETGIEHAGLLLGRVEGGEALAEAMLLGRNIDNSPTSFTIDPQAVIEAVRLEEEGVTEVIAIIHAHPCGPEPSPADLRGWEAWPIPWVIVSATDCSARAWCGREELALEVLDTQALFGGE